MVERSRRRPQEGDAEYASPSTSERTTTARATSSRSDTASSRGVAAGASESNESVTEGARRTRDAAGLAHWTEPPSGHVPKGVDSGTPRARVVNGSQSRAQAQFGWDGPDFSEAFSQPAPLNVDGLDLNDGFGSRTRDPLADFAGGPSGSATRDPLADFDLEDSRPSEARPAAEPTPVRPIPARPSGRLIGDEIEIIEDEEITASGESLDLDDTTDLASATQLRPKHRAVAADQRSVFDRPPSEQTGVGASRLRSLTEETAPLDAGFPRSVEGGSAPRDSSRAYDGLFIAAQGADNSETYGSEARSTADYNADNNDPEGYDASDQNTNDLDINDYGVNGYDAIAHEGGAGELQGGSGEPQPVDGRDRNQSSSDPNLESAHDRPAGGSGFNLLDELLSDDRRNEADTTHLAEVDDDEQTQPAPEAEANSGEIPQLAKGPGRNLVQAFSVGVVLAAIAGLALWFGSIATTALITAFAILAAIEVYDAMQRAGLRPASLLGIVGVVSLQVAIYFQGADAFPLVMALTVVFGALWYVSGADRERPVLNLGLTMMGLLWVGGLAGFGVLLVNQPGGIALLLATIIITVASDTLAYVGGRTFGSTPFHPISPNKTWEGTVAGFLGALLFGLAIGVWGGFDVFDGGVVSAVALAAVVGILAPMGDLAESMIKRDLGLKDMGTLLPGHGGVMDRLDGLLFALPGAYYIGLLFNLF